MRTVSTRVTGLLILVLGIWGGLIPFVGPYFHFVLGPDRSWHWTTGRLYLDVLPGAAAALAGLLLLGRGPHAPGKLGALIALAAGIWFAIGPDLSLLWNAGGAQGAAHGSRGIRALEMISFHTGLGAVIAMLAGFAMPGSMRRARTVVEPEPFAAPPVPETAAAAPATAAPAPAATTVAPATTMAPATTTVAPASDSVPVSQVPPSREPVTTSEPVMTPEQSTATEPVMTPVPSTATGPLTSAELAPAGEPTPSTGNQAGDDRLVLDRGHAHTRRRRRGVLSVFSRH